MKVLLDHCVPRTLRSQFVGHEVSTTYERGWQTLKNGALLNAAESDGFGALVTTDQNLPYQQNLANRHIGVLVLVARTNRAPDPLPLVPAALTALNSLRPGDLVRIEQA